MHGDLPERRQLLVVCVTEIAEYHHEAARSRDPRNARTHALEVLATVDGPRLVIELIYATSLHEAATIEAVASDVDRALDQLIEHCAGAEATATPSDFPEADLDQAALDEFLDSL